jgi:PAS domain S-box-containing protein
VIKAYFFLAGIVFSGILALIVYLIASRFRRGTKIKDHEMLVSVQNERKQLRTLIDTIPDLIFIKDRQSRFTLANARVALVMGTTPENLIGKTDFDFYSENMASKFYADEQKIMDSGIPMINFEENALDEFGNRIIRATTKVPVRSNDGTIIGLAGICRDISKLKNIENQLRKKSEDLQETNRLLENRQKEILIQSEELAEQTQNLLMINAELERLNRTKDKFFSIIAHDLRNPFNAIIGFSELLRHDYYEMDNQHKLSVLELISVSSHTAFNLLENLLEWARTQTDNINYKPENFELGEIAQTVVDLNCGTALKKGIILKNEVREEVHVHADKNMINTVLRNLVSNAIKFSNPSGEIVISVKPNKEIVEVNVSDNGIGMDRESLNKLFRIDTYYSTAGTMGESGTGLGLIICKEFIEKNNGRIKANSEKGSGTTITFTLNPSKLN